MTKEKQVQKAGDNSNQVQIDTVNVNGISEKRVREIVVEVSKRAIQDQTQEANEIFLRRVERFTDLLLPRIESIEKKFESFQEPDFQVLLKKAQISAGCSDRELDYGVLSELLVHRVKHKDNIKKKASIAKAVEIINQIDDDALCGLTMVNAIWRLIPAVSSAREGCNIINELYSKIQFTELPCGNDWVDNLEILGTIRIAPFRDDRKYVDVICDLLDGYVAVGIKKDSDNLRRAKEILNSVGVSEDFLIENEFNNNYLKIPVSSRHNIDKMGIPQDLKIDNIKINMYRKLNKDEIKAFNDVWDLYTSDFTLRQQIKDEFLRVLRSFEFIKRTETWWDERKINFSINSIGNVIAHTNAKRCCDKVPDLDV